MFINVYICETTLSKSALPWFLEQEIKNSFAVVPHAASEKVLAVNQIQL